MLDAFISLLGSLAQVNFVWHGDIVLNVAMSGGGVDWPWVCTLAAQLASETELRKKKENEVDELRLLRDRLGKLFKSTLNNRLHRNLACVIDKSSRGAKLERAFEELP